MGVIYQGECAHCGYSRQFHLGGGLGSLHWERNVRTLHPEERAELERLQQQGAVATFEGAQQLVACPCCPADTALMERTCITITGPHGEQTFGRLCPVCGAAVRVYGGGMEEPPQNVPCPHCSDHLLGFRRVGFWD